jgi:uncharacterized tellurite resistance protein B-like protein
MSIAELFESGAMKEHQGAYRNLVMIARADGVVTDAEQAMLTRMAGRLDVTDEHIEEILANPAKFPIYPPHTIQDRRERLVDLVRMAMADGEFEEQELKVLTRCSIGLGYNEEEVPQLVNRIHFHLLEGLERGEVIEAMLSER